MKVKFAHQLRAIAALSVVFYHYWGIFFSPAVRAIIGVPASFVPVKPGYAQHVMSPGQGGLLYGVFGVGVFFLISGFVIPISLRNISTGAFLVRRFFRIYPVYWFCLLISLSMYFICSWYWHTPLSDRISLKYLLETLPLLHSVTGIPSLDFVCWSLAVEVKFYVIFALVLLVGGRSAHKVLALSIGFLILCCLAAFLAAHGSNPASMLSLLTSDMKFMTFMFLGCLFYYVLYDELSVPAALGYGAIIYVLFLMITSSYEGSIGGPLARNYTYALVLFSVCYVLRERFRDNRVLDFVADISFPLYLLHSTIGYVVMSILIDHGVWFTLAWIISLGLVLLVAFGVHRYVEVPVNAFGKKVSNLAGRSPKPVQRDTLSLEGSP
ncbi:acyltransferase family protein [Pinirhizobacter soli]|uniref:acyltransferase family protein n=1 Tax=Pinirhizobacter soli TaxID=2786953 RepID=UPI00202A760A|nr:acyltransferase [Pinirhizobacter soli]